MELSLTKRTDRRLMNCMRNHYSMPQGFVGRNICYAITHDDHYYGHIVGGSATRFLPGRNEFLRVDIRQLNNIVNNIFFHVDKVNGKYPFRCFTQKVLELWVSMMIVDWQAKYGDKVLGFESLVEKPRLGTLYKRAGWSLVGETKGYTCKRVGGDGTDSYSGQRVWNTDVLYPKLVFCKIVI